MPRRSHQNQFDPRVALYRMLRLLVIAATLALAVKFFLFDTVATRGDQMAPTILCGDRLLLLRIPFLPFIGKLVTPPCDRPVLFKSIAAPGFSDCLRVVGASGDTVSIDSGTIRSGCDIDKSTRFNRTPPDLIPKAFAPRDFFNWYRVPAKNDLLLLNRVSLRDFFFARSIIAQEHPKDAVTIKPYILLDDSASSDYIISDFAFYSGRIDSVPDSLRNDWFFWNRVEEFLVQRHTGRSVRCYFSVSLNNTVLEEYRVEDDYYFMLADNRLSGLDSRDFGPIRRTRCTSVPVMVLWSNDRNGQGKMHFRFKRLGRFIS